MYVETEISVNLPSLEDTDMEELTRQVGEIMLDEIRLNFGVGGRPATWAPLKKGGPSFLFDTGDLLQSLEMVTGSTSEYYYARVQTEIPYAEYHQFGTEKMQARPFMVLPEEAMDRITEKTAGFLVDVLTSEKTKTTNKGEDF